MHYIKGNVHTTLKDDFRPLFFDELQFRLLNTLSWQVVNYQHINCPHLSVHFCIFAGAYRKNLFYISLNS